MSSPTNDKNKKKTTPKKKTTAKKAPAKKKTTAKKAPVEKKPPKKTRLADTAVRTHEKPINHLPSFVLLRENISSLCESLAVVKQGGLDIGRDIHQALIVQIQALTELTNKAFPPTVPVTSSTFVLPTDGTTKIQDPPYRTYTDGRGTPTPTPIPLPAGAPVPIVGSTSG